MPSPIQVYVVFDPDFPGDQDEIASFFDRFGTAATFVVRDQPVPEDPADARRELLGTTTVTLVLNGRVLHASAAADRELYASLLPGADGRPNGLLGVTIDRSAQKFDLPRRLHANVDSGYARFYRLPLSVPELQAWLDDAEAGRTARADQVVNDEALLAADLVPTPTWSPFLTDDGRPRAR
jgi:hypothetical protein